MIKDFSKMLILLIVISMFLFTASQASAVTVHTTDFISDITRTNFNGFEGLPEEDYYGGDNPFWVENGIMVQQINGQPNGIWTYYSAWGQEGNNSWYPSAGDHGYTSITKEDGSDFSDVGFLRGSGYSEDNTLFLYYELRLNGTVIQSDTLNHQRLAQYLGFSGGGFDEILLRDNGDWINSLSGGVNALVIDSIELSNGTPVPEPTTMLLLGSGLIGLAGYGRRRFFKK